MVDILTYEPRKLIAGDTWQWTRDFDDYPSPTWTLDYYLRHPGELSLHTFQASADGSGGFTITVAAATTQTYQPGTWELVGRVSASGVVHTVVRQRVEIVADFAQLNQDHRSYNQRMLDAIEAVREGRATTDQGSVTIGDTSISRMSWDELETQWHRFRELVARERGVNTGRVLPRLT